AWFAIGVTLLAILAPLSFFLARRTPAHPVHPAHPAHPVHPVHPGSTCQEAVSTPAFWTFSIGAALYGLVASGIGLFNESILAERGFGPEIYYQTLVVTALTALAGNFGGGWLG